MGSGLVIICNSCLVCKYTLAFNHSLITLFLKQLHINNLAFHVSDGFNCEFSGTHLLNLSSSWMRCDFLKNMAQFRRKVTECNLYSIPSHRCLYR